jgi:hypothetical protein
MDSIFGRGQGVQHSDAVIFLFSDNLLRHVEGQGWKGFWPCSGRFEVVALFGMLSLVAQSVYWSRIVSGLNQEQA